MAKPAAFVDVQKKPGGLLDLNFLDLEEKRHHYAPPVYEDALRILEETARALERDRGVEA
jgi:hypothetical protein